MVTKYLGYIFAFLVVLACQPPGEALADGASQESARAQPQKQPTLDPRMPAVLPGEEVNRNGKKMNVWSTSGSPSVSVDVPTVPSASQNWTVGDGSGQGVSVIVDGSDVLPHRHKPNPNIGKR